MNDPDFCSGFFFGFALAGILGLIFQRVNLSLKRSQQAGTKQKVVGETKLTPWQVVWQSIAAYFELFFWLLLLIVVVGGLLSILRI